MQINPPASTYSDAHCIRASTSLHTDAKGVDASRMPYDETLKLVYSTQAPPNRKNPRLAELMNYDLSKNYPHANTKFESWSDAIHAG